MIIATKAIVLSALRYGDSGLIVRLFTEKAGLQSFLIKGALKRKKGRFSSAQFQPLTQLEIVANPSRSGKLGYLKEASIGFPYRALHTDIYKSTVALFLSEMLSQSIREEAPNPQLFSYLEHSFQWLDQHSHIANFHIRFLIGLTRYLGFFPDLSRQEAAYFDLTEGAFCLKPSLNPTISGETLSLFRQFLGTKFDEIEEVKISQKQRQSLLRMLVDYFEIHLHGFRKPRSLAIFDEVFS